jgi:ketosteroid isomerase-like protein
MRGEEFMREPRANPLLAAVLILTFGLPAAALAANPPGTAELAAQLRATEEAFARTMADRDHAAFVSFLAEEAVFFGRAGELRGREAVAAAWKPLYEGAAATFTWQPEVATVLDSGTLGLTSGPVFAPDGRRIGTFNSVWRREPDGSWKIIFDRGCPDCECPPAAAADS